MEIYETIRKSKKREWDITLKVVYNKKLEVLEWIFKTMDGEQKGKIKLIDNIFPNIKLGFPDDDGIRTKVIKVFSKFKDSILESLPSTTVHNVQDVQDVQDSVLDIMDNGQEIKSSIFGDNICEKILEFLTDKKEGYTVVNISEKLLKNQESVWKAIQRNSAYFDQNKPDGKVVQVVLSKTAIDEINQRISNYYKKIELEESEKERLSNKEKAEKKQVDDIINDFKSFFNDNKKNKEVININRDSVVIIDFEVLSKHSPILSECVLTRPAETLQLFELAMESSGIFGKDIKIRMRNLPQSSVCLIENLRAKHLDTFMSIRGKILQASDSRPQVVNARFECPSCGTIISVLQMEKKFREPSRCSCGRRGGFTLKSKEMTDTARLIIEDLHELSENSSPKRLNCFVKEDLASGKILNRMLQAGNDVMVIGELKEVPVPMPNGGMSTRFELALEVNHIELIQEEVDLNKLTDDEIEDFEKLAHRIDEKGISELCDSFAPVVQGYDEVKQALALYPCNKLNNPGVDEERNKSNILLIGDPSTSKSVLARFLTDVCVGGKKVVGGSTSAVGITGALIKDEYLGGWMLNPGALVLANGILFIEELNTMPDEEKAKIQDAMESQFVDITKANVSGRFKVKTGIVSCANPIHGHFIQVNSEREMVKQFNIPSPILSRFDAIFLFRDKVDSDNDYKISMSMKMRRSKKLEVEFDKDFLKKFFYYTQHRKEPEMSEEFNIISSKVYSIIRSMVGEEVNVRARVSEAIDRMCIASAKIRGSNKCEEKDLERVVNILSHSYLAISDYSEIKGKLLFK